MFWRGAVHVALLSREKRMPSKGHCTHQLPQLPRVMVRSRGSRLSPCVEVYG
jgi:hypothetical protein